MDQNHFQKNIQALYAIVKDLESMFPGRPFTPDGHLVGSIGECLVADAYAYGLNLMPPSNQGFDALAPDGRKVEIKATQRRSVAFRSCPEHVIIIRILKDGSFEEHFNGPGKIVWDTFKGRKRPSNGQFQISLSKAIELDKSVDESERIQLPTS